MGPYLILRRVGNVAYQLDLPLSLGPVYLVFHVSMLKNFVGYSSLDVPIESVGILDSLSNEKIPLKILDKQVHHLRTKDVTSIKVLWRNQKIEDATWKLKRTRSSDICSCFSN